MPWEKPPPDLVERFAAALPEDPRLERRKMFGCPCAFCGGNLFAGVHESNVMIRLPEDAKALVLAAGGARFAPMGRAMGDYVTLPKADTADRDRLARWLAVALDHAATLPVKPAKPGPVTRGRKR